MAAALAMMEEAIASGLDVHADRYPYVAFNTGLTNLFPLWSRDGGTEKFLERLKDPALASRLRTEVQRKVDGLGSWDAVMISSVKHEENKHYQGKTILQISARRAGPTPTNSLCPCNCRRMPASGWSGSAWTNPERKWCSHGRIPWSHRMPARAHPEMAPGRIPVPMAPSPARSRTISGRGRSRRCLT